MCKFYLPFFMEIYHGSYMAVAEPKILRGRFTIDFGDGFYCTEILRQADRWAKRYETPIVSIYEYAPSASLDIKQFDIMTDEWLDFIVACRAGGSHEHDIVIGAMADDQIFNYVADFIDGLITREQFWVLARFRHPTQQICFCSEASLACLRFIKSEELK